MRITPGFQGALASAILLFLLTNNLAEAAQACHPDAPDVARVTALYNATLMNITRARCYHDVAFYYNSALQATPNFAEWFEPFVRQLWAYNLRSFGSCAVQRNSSIYSGRACENFGAPKPLVIFAWLSNTNRTYGETRFMARDGAYRNFIKIEATSFTGGAVDSIKDRLGHEMAIVATQGAQGTHARSTWALWTTDYGWSRFPIYDFYHQTGDFVSRDRYYPFWAARTINGNPAGSTNVAWFAFFYGLWLETGQNIKFMTKFWRYYGMYSNIPLDTSDNVYRTPEDMSLGELTHFMSASVGRNLSTTAASRFNTGWSPQSYWDAISLYPALTYPS
ncbi:hypothetical protein DFS34DRAFT_687534 [Phlyctochytrium arcticum]|nr:hypothetical protein DFS34DRAFT_687534 [Phlyctochytrium arcticum]